MQPLEQALEEIRGLHHKVLGWPPPELTPQTYAPFPYGVDPLKHALFEVQHLKEISEQLARAPRPGAWMPFADCLLSEQELVVRMDVPGMVAADLEVFVVAGECVVRGERKAPETTVGVRPVSVERPFGPFERRFPLPVGALPGEAKARATDGVLELRIPLSGGELAEQQQVKVE